MNTQLHQTITFVLLILTGCIGIFSMILVILGTLNIEFGVPVAIVTSLVITFKLTKP